MKVEPRSHGADAPDDEWLSDVREWRATRPKPQPSTRPRKPRKADREQGPIAAFLTVAGILLGAFFLFGWIVLNMKPSDYDLQFSPGELPATAVGAPYGVAVSVSHNASPISGASVSGGELPPGLNLVVERNDLDAVVAIRISGSSTSAGTYPFTLAVWTGGTDVLNYHVDAQRSFCDYVIVVN